ncbi:MAG: signal peptide peptidase SppA [Pseudomonadota bacterium]
MTSDSPNVVLRLLRGLWNLLDGTRKVVFNVVFLLLAFLFLGALFSDSTPMVEDGTTLRIKPVGLVVEQFTIDPYERALAEAMNQPVLEVRFRDLLTAIERATEDDRISQIVLSLDRMVASPAQLAELSRALTRFKASGKPVLAYSEGMLQGQYYLAALADEIWLHPEGLMLLEGFGVYRNYYKELLDKLDVDIHLFRVGEFKSAAEPYVRNDMSPESREANAYWLGGLWDQFLDHIAAERGIERNHLIGDIGAPADRLREAGGSPAAMALEQSLVDNIGDHDAFVARVIESGTSAKRGKDYRRVDVGTYLQATQPLSTSPDKVGVVIAQGPITFGDQPSGTIGGSSLVEQLRTARQDPRVKAIVLRVDSPGGAVLPSEKIRAEVAAIREAGTPVVVSMGGVAASGGYWISMSADRIVAEATTITGSIGIFGMITNIPRTLARIGVHTDGVGTAPLAGAFRIDRPLEPEAAELIQLVIEDGYDDFIGGVAENRELDKDAVDAVARGRVWTGTQALERGLVDEIGGLREAIDRAAELASLDNPGVFIFEKRPGAFEQFLLDLSASVAQHFPQATQTGPLAALIDAAGTLPPELELLLSQPDGRLGTFAFCFCSP